MPLPATLQPGDCAPDAILLTLDGRMVSLAETWGAGRSAVLVFLRHLG
jgi:hypothetical protein